MDKLVSKLLQSQLQSQIYHMRVANEVGSFAAHLALQEYYEGMVGMIDGLVESYQGKSTNLVLFQQEWETSNDARIHNIVEYFEELAKDVELQSEVIEDGFLKSQVEDIQALIYTTIYKLKRLQ